ncbi:DUF4126 domain-containing protein [Microbacterium aurantiacum]|uniref:DUF4126 domain-containing protein n=1 Tax=Microbacterium aurantiacum TaxID=162393 RepID=A0AAJ2HKH1_9MICO|nr:DUF4126 domain-containing protein [Microbacterium aurantiacum]MDS0245989.1 DUF4126 domain-containing protein [Microbacterium aurantiacum]
MLEFMVGSSLAAAAGLNAWMPLLVLGLADRLLPAVQLPAAWSWLSSDVALWIVGILLVLEIVADKIPAVDSINDVVQTLIRPAAGGVVFGAGSGAESLAVDDPATLVSDGGWIPIVLGIAIALGVHALKALSRPIVNAATAGIAAPLVSSVEDASALTLSVLALLAPLLGFLLLLTGVVAAVWGVRRARRRQRRRAAMSDGRPSHTAST